MSNRRISEFYASGRDRGQEPPQFNPRRPAPVQQEGRLAQILGGPVKRFEELYPGQRCRWEHMPNKEDMSTVGFREAQGYHIVKAEELNPDTESAQRTGPIRRGDLILMAAPVEVHEALLAQDAQAADDDFRTPELTYKEELSRKQYASTDGGTTPGVGFGKIKRTYEEGSPEQFHEGPTVE